MATYYRPPYAQIHFRLAAWLLDNIIFAVLGLVPILIAIAVLSRTESLVMILTLQAFYYLVPMVFFHTTPAKRILNMQIVMYDGSPLMPDTAILRYLVFFLTTFIPGGLLVSGILLFIDPERRTFHDRLAKTAVISEYSRP